MSELKSYRIDGMSCEGCARSVTTAIRKLAPGAAVEVDVGGGVVRVGDEAGEELVHQAVERAGFTWRGEAAA